MYKFFTEDNTEKKNANRIPSFPEGFSSFSNEFVTVQILN